MKPHLKRSIAVIFTLLIFITTHQLVHSTTKLTENAWTKNEAILKLRTLIRTVTEEIDMEDEDFTIVTQDNKGIHLRGTAAFFGTQNVVLEAILGNTLVEITSTFPTGASKQIYLAGQNLMDWLPTFMHDKIDLQQLQFQFFPKEENRLTLIATLGQAPHVRVIDYNGFAIGQPNLTFQLDRSGGTTPQTTATASLAGNLRLGMLNFALAAVANTDRDWRFVGSLQELKIRDFVTNVGSHLRINMPPMPNAIANFSIQQAALMLNSDRSVHLTGTSDLGQIEAFFAPKTGQAANFLLGFRLPPTFKLEKISNVLQPIDALNLSDIALIYAANQQQVAQKLTLLAGMTLSATTVKPGLTMMGGFDIPEDLPGMTSRGKVLMRANIPANLSAAPTLQAIVQFNGLQLGDAFALREAFLQLAPVDLSFGVGLGLSANFDGSWINFAGMGEIAAPATFGLVIYMEEGSVWKNPFGVQGVEIANLGLDVGADVLSPLPRPKLGVSGALKIGPFAGEGAGMVNTANPSESLISLKMNEIGMQQFSNAFLSSKVVQEINKIPAPLRDFGLRDAELTIIPKTTQVAGRTYNQGLRISGRGNIIGLGARLDVNASFDSGFKGLAAVSPIILREGNTTIFQLSGNNAADSARMFINMTLGNFLNPTEPFYLVDGKVGLLGMTSQTKVEIDKRGIYFFTQGNLFGKFNAALDAKGGNFDDVKGFYIRAAMKNELISYLNREATKAIDNATKSTQNAYRTAKNDLEQAKKELNRRQDALDRAIRIKNEKDAELAKAWDQIPKELCKKVNLGFTKKRFCIPVPTHSIPSKVCKSFPVVGNICIPLPNHSNLKKLIGNAEKAARDAAAEVTSSKTSRDIAQGTLTTAQKAMDIFEKGTTGTLKASRWIVDKGLGGIIDVKSAEFAGQLNALKGGQVSMQINTTFLNKNHHASIGFNFADPISAAKSLADLLLNDRASNGLASTFGNELGKR